MTNKQLTLELEIFPKPPQTQPKSPQDSDSLFQCFTDNTDRTEAVRSFQARYGQPPELVFQEYGLLWCGPVNHYGLVTANQETSK
jgi:hypothetical protein